MSLGGPAGGGTVYTEKAWQGGTEIPPQPRLGGGTRLITGPGLGGLFPPPQPPPPNSCMVPTDSIYCCNFEIDHVLLDLCYYSHCIVSSQ